MRTCNSIGKAAGNKNRSDTGKEQLVGSTQPVIGNVVRERIERGTSTLMDPFAKGNRPKDHRRQTKTKGTDH